MGLTIHYSLSLPAKMTVPEVKQKLGALRQHCLDLPFQEVGEMLEFRGSEDCNFQKRGQDDPLRWFLCQADCDVYFKIARTGKPVAVPTVENGCYIRTILPEHIIGFRTYPGNGSEDANVGLSRFPKTVMVENRANGKCYRLPVQGGGGWKWHSFCKTQFSNSPECGGLPNFLKVHLSVVAMLDCAKRIGFDVEVSDEGGYWEKRNVHALVKEIGSWDQLLAGFGGMLKDSAGDAGMEVESPIFNRRDFETLELAGQSQLPPAWNQVLQSLVATTAAVQAVQNGRKDALKALLKSPRMRHGAVSGRYSGQVRVSGNRIRLWAIVRLFRLSPSAVAKATGFSRPYVARLLSRNDDFTASPEFWRMLECKLGTIIDGRASQIFTVPAVSVARARGVMEGMPDQVQVATVEGAVDRLFPEVQQAA